MVYGGLGSPDIGLVIRRAQSSRKAEKRRTIRRTLGKDGGESSGGGGVGLQKATPRF